MTRVLALADQSKIGCITQRRFAKVGTKTHPQRGADLDRNGLSVSTETACRFEPKSPVGNSEICILGFRRTAELTIRGGGKPYSNMALDADLENGPPPGTSPPMRMTASWSGSERTYRIQVR